MTDWTFGGTWPYEPRWFDTPDGRLHYVDHGPRDGRPVVMTHGNPTWSYLYRHFIGALGRAGYRAIAPDLLGFGRSDKPLDPADYPGAPPENLVPGSLVFARTPGPVDLRHLSQWWTWTPGASWQHPEGPRSSLEGRFAVANLGFRCANDA